MLSVDDVLNDLAEEGPEHDVAVEFIKARPEASVNDLIKFLDDAFLRGVKGE